MKSKDTIRPQVTAAFPPILEGYFKPNMFKILFGGRGSSKSWTVARSYVIEAAHSKHRYLCTREFQSTLDDSVIKLLSDQIYDLGLTRLYDVHDKGIYCHKTGSEFIFKGLRKDPHGIRSMEGIDRCWVEEAQAVSKNSWRILIPTLFRRPGCELSITFNPHLETDPVYQDFVLHPPPGAYVQMVNWRDNPWFPEAHNQIRLHDLKNDPEAYRWTWEGECLKLSEAVIFRNRAVVETFETPATARFYYGADWGFADDPAACIRCFISPENDPDPFNRILYIDYEAFGYHVELDDLPALFRKVPGSEQWAVRADSQNPGQISYMQRHGFPNMVAADKWPGSVEDGINFLKSFKKIVIHERCENMAKEAMLYSYKTDPKTDEVLPIVVDKHNHGWDSCRYALGDLISGESNESVFDIPESARLWAKAGTRGRYY